MSAFGAISQIPRQRGRSVGLYFRYEIQPTACIESKVDYETRGKTYNG